MHDLLQSRGFVRSASAEELTEEDLSESQKPMKQTPPKTVQESTEGEGAVGRSKRSEARRCCCLASEALPMRTDVSNALENVL